MKSRNNIYACDFETTTIEPAKVWCYTMCNIDATELDQVEIGGTLTDFMIKIFKMSSKKSILLYFYNLKFDGTFIIFWLYKNGFKLDAKNFSPKEKKTFVTLISEDGIIYQIKILYSKFVITINCSYRLFLSKLSKAGESFNCKWKKTAIDYDAHNNTISQMSQKEIEYAKIDVLIEAELLRYYYDNFDKVKLTVGGQALYEFYELEKETKAQMENINPDVDAFMRKAYEGGICYVNPKYENKIVECLNGGVYDFNSMYPSMMHSTSNNSYPIGVPLRFVGKTEFDKIKNKYLYIVRFFCIFEIKKKYVPCVSIGGGYFNVKKWATSSKGHNVELTLCTPDFENFLKSYNIKNLKIFDGYYFEKSKIGIADNFINHFYKIKKESSGAKKQFAKYMLNSLTGKFGTRIESKTKLLKYENSDAPLYSEYKKESRKGVYLPFVIFITAYARVTLCEVIHDNYDNFIYCDTDSVHLTDITNVKIKEGKELGEWKLENKILKCKYIRQKCYIDKIDEKVYNIKVAGLPESARIDTKNDENFEIYKIGAIFKNVKLVPKMVAGGVILVKTDFTIKDF